MAARKKTPTTDLYPKLLNVRLRVIDGGLGRSRKPRKVDHRSELDQSEDVVIEQQHLLRRISTRLTLMNKPVAELSRMSFCGRESIIKALEGGFIRPSHLTIRRLARLARIRIIEIDEDDDTYGRPAKTSKRRK